MKKIYSFLDEYIVQVCILISVIVGLVLLNSCNPVKQVLKDEAKMKQVWEKGVLKDWCTNDSVYTSDTIVTLDTLHLLETSTDTVTINDTVRITKTEYKYITKTVNIRDTTVVTDRSKENLLQKEVNKGLEEQSKQLAKIVALEKANSELRKSKNKAWTFVWIILAIIGVYLFRKPLRFAFNRISPIKI